MAVRQRPYKKDFSFWYAKSGYEPFWSLCQGIKVMVGCCQVCFQVNLSCGRLRRSKSSPSYQCAISPDAMVDTYKIQLTTMSTANDRLYAEDVCSSWRIKQDGHAARYWRRDWRTCVHQLYLGWKETKTTSSFGWFCGNHLSTTIPLLSGDMQKACYVTQQLEQDNMAYWIDDAIYQTKQKGSW